MHLNTQKQKARTGFFYKFYLRSITKRLAKYNNLARNPKRTRAFLYESKMISMIVDSNLKEQDKKNLLCTIAANHGKDKFIYWLGRNQNDFLFKKMMYITYGQETLEINKFIDIFLNYVKGNYKATN